MVEVESRVLIPPGAAVSIQDDSIPKIVMHPRRMEAWVPNSDVEYEMYLATSCSP